MQRTEGAPGSKRRWVTMVVAGVVPLLGLWLLVGYGMTISPGAARAADESRLLRHVVQFQFKESSSAAEVAGVVDAFRKLPQKISEIADFEYGVNNSPEGLADGFTHCFLVTFRTEKERSVYLSHPDHRQFVDLLKPHLEKVQVIDYWASK